MFLLSTLCKWTPDGYGNVNDNDGNSHDKYVDSIDLIATANFIFLKWRLRAEEWGSRAEGKGKPRPYKFHYFQLRLCLFLIIWLCLKRVFVFLALSRINSIVTVLRNRLVWPGWSAKIIHKNIVIFKNTTYIIFLSCLCKLHFPRSHFSTPASV